MDMLRHMILLKKKIYHIYADDNNTSHCSLIVYNKEEIVKLIESSWDSYIRIWNFHTGELFKKIEINYKYLNGICLWNKDYLFIGTSDTYIKLLDINNETIINEFSGHNNNVVTIKKIIHSKYGECLITQGIYNEPIKLWILKN